MPIFKAADKLVYYAHVPKCGGSSVNWYLAQRFGKLAFSDSRHTDRPPAQRWSRSSPQHVDCASLARLFPEGFFDAAFAIVRHPVARLVSAYHFQRDVEKTVPAATGFGEWLEDIAERRAADPFVFDNHVRPMDEIVPEGAAVFHAEHGLDAIIDWLDALTGSTAGPRALPRINEQGQNAGTARDRAVPGPADLARIDALYARDLERFGYRTGTPAPLAAAPELPEARRREIAAARKAMASPLGRVRRKLGRLGL
ncbi:sulfotransferase family 2 domain-containing protein [Poseidonocella sp. HB161398]|uniref:sulfotransferase family 2 domain-containing protein n=1 Tax=Poseidonocella sp. HB161398 TaxID=2320855 RepID=UPI001486942D|nr:sulfotransferase family 2 domain-containing protein [Poseidonocella sp. HB161398]